MASAQRPFLPLNFKTRLPALDGIRAFAVLLIFFHHFGGGAHGGRVLNFLNEARMRGWVGVDIFFALSGFLITGILFDTRTDSHFFLRFYVRRSLRIFPVFYLTLLLLLLLTPVFHYRWRWPHLAFPLYLGNFWGNADLSLYDIPSPNHPSAKLFLGHFWSLFVEEQFYLLWPLVVWFVRDRVQLLWTAAGLSVLALLLRSVEVALFPLSVAETWVFRTLPFRMDALLIGAILALLLRGPKADLWQRRSGPIALAAGLLALLIFVLSPSYDSPWLLTLGLSLTPLAGAGLIGMTLPAGEAFERFFHLRPMRTLGRYSYGFYLFHTIFGWAWIQLLVTLNHRLHSITLAGILALAANFFVTFVISKLSYDLFERRFLVLKRGFEYDSEITTHTHAFSTAP